MAATSGMEELVSAVRAFLLTSPIVAAEGVFWGRATREEELPYVILDIIPGRVIKSLRADTMREYQIQVKVCATHEGNKSAVAIAAPIKNAVFELFTEPQGDTTPQDALNAFLIPKGFRANPILETGDLQPYRDFVGASRDVERWHIGNRYDLRIASVA